MQDRKVEEYGEIYLRRKTARGLKKPYSNRTLDDIGGFVAGDILEIGPGIGDNINHLVNSRTSSYTAIEPDKRLFEELRNNFSFDLKKNLFCDSFPSKKIEGLAFDTILSFEVIEHLPGSSAFLEQCRGLLKPDGHIIVSTPNKYIYRMVAHLVDGGPDPTHINEMSFRAFRKVFGRYFTIVYSNYTLPLFPRLSEKLGSERLFSVSEDLAGIFRPLSLNVMLVGKKLLTPPS